MPARPQSRAVWAERPPLIQWGEEKDSPVKVLIGAFVWFALIGFVCRVLWAVAS